MSVKKVERDYARRYLGTAAEFRRPDKVKHIDRCLCIADSAGPRGSARHAAARDAPRACLEDDLGVEMIQVLKAGFAAILLGRA